MRFGEMACVALAEILQNVKGLKRENYQEIMHSNSGYQKWRNDELITQFTENFKESDLVNKDVLDFGCGNGDLSFFCKEAGAGKVIGLDLDAARIKNANQRKKEEAWDDGVDFSISRNSRKIDIEDNSVDIIVCFDVIEHVMQIDDILKEFFRVLRKNGRIFIWWSPWWGPFGHHIESLVPIPWGHAVFSEQTLITAAAEMYDRKRFVPKIWDIDPETGLKKSNKWRNLKELPDVNRLSVKGFEQKLTQLEKRGIPMDIAASYHGFKGSRLSRMTNIFLKGPLKEFFMSFVTYNIHKQ